MLQRIPRVRQARNTDSFTSEESVAATTNNAPCRSRGKNLRRRQVTLPVRARLRIRVTARGLTTTTSAPCCSNPATLSAAMRPAPTTTHFRSSSFSMMGNRLTDSAPRRFMVSHLYSLSNDKPYSTTGGRNFQSLGAILIHNSDCDHFVGKPGELECVLARQTMSVYLPVGPRRGPRSI
jgi:hypothetical protein